MTITNRTGGNNGLGKALILTGLPVMLLDPRLGLGVMGAGIVIGTIELLKDQRPEVRKEVEKIIGGSEAENINKPSSRER